MIRFPDVPDRPGQLRSALLARVRSGRPWITTTGDPTPGADPRRDNPRGWSQRPSVPIPGLG